MGCDVRIERLRSPPRDFAIEPGIHQAITPLAHQERLQPGKGVDLILWQSFVIQLPSRIARKDRFQHSLSMKLSRQIKMVESGKNCLDYLHASGSAKGSWRTAVHRRSWRV